MDKETYLALKAEIEDECRHKIEALDMVWAMLEKHQDVTARKSKPVRKAAPIQKATPEPTADLWQTQDNGSQSAFSPTDATKNAILDLSFDTDITQPLILRKVLAAYPEVEKTRPTTQLAAQIAGALRRLEKQGLVKSVKESKGRNPAIYRRKPKEEAEKN